MELQQIIALGLLAARVAASVYLVKVLSLQRSLLRLPAVDENGDVSDEAMRFRAILHRMTWVIFVGQFVPIAIDFANLLNGESPQWLGFLYAISNAITALTAAILIWRLYQMAENVEEANALIRAHVQREHDKELKDKS